MDVLTSKTLSEQVKELILRRIADGHYPVGTRLPGVRVMAEELGVNRNTVSKVYQELSARGITTREAGKGVFVTRRPKVEGTEEKDDLDRDIERVIWKARVRGIPMKQLLERFRNRALSDEGQPMVRLAFTECHSFDTESIAEQLGRLLALPVKPLTLGEILKDPEGVAAEYDLFLTTFYHLSEVKEAFESLEKRPEVIGLNHQPTSESLLRVAEIPSRHVVGLICQNQRTLDHIRSIVSRYHAGEILGAVLEDEPWMTRVLAESDIIIDHAQVHDRISRVTRLPILTMDFQTDEQSLEYLRRKVEEFYKFGERDFVS